MPFWKRKVSLLTIVKAVVAVYLLTLLIKPFKGESSFAVTTAYYFVVIAFLIWMAQKTQATVLGTVCISVVLSFYLAEFILRYVVSEPVTYSEKQSGEYYSIYGASAAGEGFLEGIFHHDQNRHLLLFEPNSVRDYETPEFTYRGERINALGLRGKLPAKGSKVICALGDSFTESVGAPGDSTYPLLLEQLIHTGDSSSSVINAGRSGSDPFFEFKLLQYLAGLYQVKKAVFMINSGDLIDVISRGGSERFLAGNQLRFRPSPWWEPIYEVSFVFRLAMKVFGGYNVNLMTPRMEVLENKRAMEKIYELFRNEIIPWGNKNGIEVIIVQQPFNFNFKPNDELYALMQTKLGRLRGAAFFDLRSAMQQIPDVESYYWKQNGHFNSRGYRLIARLISANVSFK